MYMKSYRFTAAALCAAICAGAADASFAADINLGSRRPVNTITVSGDPGIIEYSNAGSVWTRIPYRIVGDTCYFDTVDARLLRLGGGVQFGGSGFYTESAALEGGFETEYERLRDGLFATGKKSALSELEAEYEKYIAISNDKNISRYNTLCIRQELEQYMDNLKSAEFNLDEQIAAARVSVLKSISESYAYSSSMDTAAQKLYQGAAITISSAEDSMWADISMTKTVGGKTVLDSASLTSVYKNIYAMAMAYQCERSKFYHNAQMLDRIKTTLENADKYYYNKDTKMYGNWWDFLIGVPSRYCKILSIVWDDLGESEKERYAAALQKFCDYNAYSGADVKPNEHQAGANLVNIANYDYIMGVLTADETKIENAVEKFYSVFEYNQEVLGLNLNGSYSDGFYSDGSFLQHGVPYNGNYGREFFVGIIDMAESLNNTRWGFGEERYERINEWIDNGFIPFIFRGSVMDMVSGRGASRNNTDKTYGYQIARSILHYAELLHDENKKREYIETVKYWFENSAAVNGIAWQTNCDDFSKSLINSTEYAAVDHTAIGKVYAYPNMDRAVYRPNNDWSAGIAMYSSRIPSYEVTNGENTKGWYTGSGAVYLYNDDNTHFAKDYWLAADMYYIPGTTVDSTVRYYDGSTSADSTNAHYQNGDGEGTSNRDFVGSMSFGSGGAAAMQLDQSELPFFSGMTRSSLSANKSYFMMPDGILCMGTAIKGGNGLTYTCVENRAVNENDFRMYIDGVLQTNLTGGTAPNAETVSIAGSCGAISYYFPKGGAPVLNTSHRSVSAQDVNVNNRGTVSGTFFTMKLNHTTDVNEADKTSYCYMLLPGKTAADADSFAKNPNMNILEMSEDIHAVSYVEGSKTVTAAAFFKPGTIKTQSGRDVSCDSQALVMMDSDGNIAVTDITRKFSEITVTIDGSEVKFDTSAAFGRTVYSEY